MPIECSVEIFAVGQEQFHALDRSLMRHAFELHNALGRFLDERIYQDEMARRCDGEGMKCHREVEIRVSHGNFVKSYFLDLLIEGSSIYELKSVDSLVPSHQNQLINYLLLTGTNHGKLVNFRPPSVESRFVSTQLGRSDRMRFNLDDTACSKAEGSPALRNSLVALLEDWGAYLDINLYREALLHILHGPDSGFQPVGIEVNGTTIGFQKMCLLNPECAWHLSAIKSNQQSHEKHIRRLMQHTRLNSILWINFNQQNITLKTLQK